MAHNPIPEDLHEQFRELHALGYGRNRLARELGIPPVQVSRGAEAMGLTFDRSRIQAATEARLADLAERRAIMAEDLQADAERLRQEIWEPRTYWDWGGKDHEYDERVHDATPGDKRALMNATATAIDRSLRLVPAEESSNLDSAKSMLGSLGAALVAFTRAEDEREESAVEGDGEA